MVASEELPPLWAKRVQELIDEVERLRAQVEQLEHWKWSAAITLTQEHAEVERLRADREWRPIEETAPGFEETMLVWCRGNKCVRLAMHRRGAWFALDDQDNQFDPTHWMPLPKPPQNDSGAPASPSLPRSDDAGAPESAL